VTGFVPAIVKVKPVLHFLKILWEKVLLAFSFEVLCLPKEWGKFSIFILLKMIRCFQIATLCAKTILFSAFMGLAYCSS